MGLGGGPGGGSRDRPDPGLPPPPLGLPASTPGVCTAVRPPLWAPTRADSQRLPCALCPASPQDCPWGSVSPGFLPEGVVC